jgi:cytochrome oxidase Cu insertion factor (SCO1/SenC/PrrC family)
MQSLAEIGHFACPLPSLPCQVRGRWLVVLSLLLLSTAGVHGAVPVAFTLRDQLPHSWQADHGEMLHLDEFKGRRLVFTMAYSTCHRICPAAITRLGELQRDFDASATSAEFFVVSYDPANDDPATWRRYRKSHRLSRDNWHFLTGTPEATAQLARQLGFEFWNYDEHVIHDYRIVVLGADGALQAAIDATHPYLQELP